MADQLGGIGAVHDTSSWHLIGISGRTDCSEFVFWTLLAATFGRACNVARRATRHPAAGRGNPGPTPQIMSFFVSQRITGQPMNTGNQQVSTR